MTSDEQLLARWREGDTAAGDALLGRYMAGLSRFFSTKAFDAAEELVQATLEAIVSARDRFAGQSSFRTYVFGTARHVLYAHFRRQKRALPIDFGVSSVQMLGPSPSEVIAAADDRRRVLRALQSMPLEQQILLELVYWEELSIREVAEIFSVPTGTLKSRLRLARSRLERTLHELGGEA